MADMKFKFTIQEYQTDAVDSVVKVFAGQSFQNKINYRIDSGTKEIDNGMFQDISSDELFLGFANAPVELNSDGILKNIREIQGNNNIKQSESLSKHMGCCSLDVEMETGERVIIVTGCINVLVSRVSGTLTKYNSCIA